MLSKIIMMMLVITLREMDFEDEGNLSLLPQSCMRHSCFQCSFDVSHKSEPDSLSVVLESFPQESKVFLKLIHCNLWSKRED
jgi:hypothetical protein